MAIFEKEKDSTSSGPGTVVGTHVKLTGILKDTNDITVHGQVEGEVFSDHNVLVTETAEIKGPISAQNVVISGKVTGAVTAAQKVEITATGKVFGSLAMKDLTIRSGAVFIGKSAMPDKDRDTASATKPITTPTKATKEPSPAPTKPLTYDIED